jgi:hypothetical protein
MALELIVCCALIEGWALACLAFELWTWRVERRDRLRAAAARPRHFPPGYLAELAP